MKVVVFGSGLLYISLQDDGSGNLLRHGKALRVGAGVAAIGVAGVVAKELDGSSAGLLAGTAAGGLAVTAVGGMVGTICW